MPNSPAIRLTETASYPSCANSRRAVMRIFSFVPIFLRLPISKRAFTEYYSKRPFTCQDGKIYESAIRQVKRTVSASGVAHRSPAAPRPRPFNVFVCTFAASAPRQLRIDIFYVPAEVWPTPFVKRIERRRNGTAEAVPFSESDRILFDNRRQNWTAFAF